jgi:hypothetical protein
MLFRNIFISALALGAPAFLAIPATATELPKEGRCKYKVSTEGKQSFEIIDRVRLDGVAAWDENQKSSEACGAFPPMMIRHCFGLNEITGGAAVTHGYCVERDADNDAIVWKVAPHAVDATDAIPTEVLMATGKYKGMNGKAVSKCAFGGTPENYSLSCDVEMTFKFP